MIEVKGLRDPFYGEGIQCVYAYKNYLKSGDKKYLGRILDHNVACLLQEVALTGLRMHLV
jgi:hypothetical protein